MSVTSVHDYLEGLRANPPADDASPAERDAYVNEFTRCGPHEAGPYSIEQVNALSTLDRKGGDMNRAPDEKYVNATIFGDGSVHLEEARLAVPPIHPQAILANRFLFVLHAFDPGVSQIQCDVVLTDQGVRAPAK